MRLDKATREAVRAAYDGKCATCASVDGPFDVDHIRPSADFGTDALENLQLLCRPCHREKTRAENRDRMAKYSSGERPRMPYGPERPPAPRPTPAADPWAEVREALADPSHELLSACQRLGLLLATATHQTS